MLKYIDWMIQIIQIRKNKKISHSKDVDKNPFDDKRSSFSEEVIRILPQDCFGSVWIRFDKRIKGKNKARWEGIKI